MANRLNVANIGYDDNNDALTIASDGTISAGTLGSGVVFPAGGTGNPISVAVICDEKASGTNGGTFTAGSWQTRDLNTEISDPDGIVSISSNQFTLQAGTYLIEWSCPAWRVNRHQSKLYSVTDSADLALGSCEYSNDTYFGLNQALGSYVHTTSGSHTYEVRHYSQTTITTEGFGIFSPSSSASIYTIVKISKLK